MRTTLASQGSSDTKRELRIQTRPPSSKSSSHRANTHHSTFSPFFGLCNCGKLLPLRLSGGLTIELTLADADAAVINGSSTSYELQEMSIRCSVVKLDSALESSFASQLMQNKSSSLRFATHSCQAMVLQPGSTEMNVSLQRAYSRLSACSSPFRAVRVPPRQTLTRQPHFSIHRNS